MNLREHFKQLPQQEQQKLTKEEKIEINNKDLVVKHNALINATNNYKYETNELKLISFLISSINNTYDKEFKKYEDQYFDLKELNFSDEDITNKLYIKQLCISIMSKPFVIDKCVYNWFTKLTYEDGIIRYEFHNDLKPFLLDLKSQFTKYHLTNILKLRSSYSIQIFELLYQYKTIKQRKMTFEELRKILNIPDSYRNVDIRKILDNVQKDLEKNTSIQFDFTIEKIGRSFNSIIFNISKNTNNTNIEDINEDSTIKTKKS